MSVDKRTPVVVNLSQRWKIGIIEDYDYSISFVQTMRETSSIPFLATHVPELQSDSRLSQKKSHKVLANVDILDAI